MNLERSGIHHMAQNVGEIVYVKKNMKKQKKKMHPNFNISKNVKHTTQGQFGAVHESPPLMKLERYRSRIRG